MKDIMRNRVLIYSESISPTTYLLMTKGKIVNLDVGKSLQVIDINVTSDENSRIRCLLICYSDKDMASFAINALTEQILDKVKMRDILQNNEPVFFRFVKDKNKELSKWRETKETWHLNAMCDSGPEKGH